MKKKSVWFAAAGGLAVLALCLIVFAGRAKAEPGRDLRLSGKSTSTKLFEEVYTNPGVKIAPKEITDTFGDAKLELKNMEYVEGVFSADVLLTDGETVYTFREEGPLGRGYKEQLSDSRSVVWGCGGEEPRREGPRVIFFELTYGDFDNTNRYADQKETAENALRVYVLRDDTIYMFERSIPRELNWIEPLELEQNHNALRDTAGWLFEFIKPNNH